MTKKIIIVESPSKVKILNSFLGKDYLVTACYGHIRNIPTKSNQVYFENQEVKTNWHYLPSVSKLKEFVEKSKCEEILIATDPDREGERIAMDLRDLWSQNYKIKRITFNAITKEEVLKAIKNPRLVNESKANAAKTRAIIDYYFGFNISPWLWKVLPQAKAMGRVQAPSLHWIVGKELSNLQKKIEYVCTVSLINKEYDIVMKCKYEDFSKFYNDIKGYPLIFRNIDFNSRRSVSQPIEPFNTLTIQKYMSSKFRISAQLLMRYLQDLYAGDRKSVV